MATHKRRAEGSLGVGVGTGVERRREVLRQAGVALQRRVVILWEVSSAAQPVAVMCSEKNPPYHATNLDLEATLRRWGMPIAPGSRWVGCRLSDADGWCVAPVRPAPAPPPPGMERRTPERLTLELAGLCLGLLESDAGRLA